MHADIADTLHIGDVGTATIVLAFCIWGAQCTLAPPGEYDWTVHVRVARRCSLRPISNYFDHFLLLTPSTGGTATTRLSEFGNKIPVGLSPIGQVKWS